MKILLYNDYKSIIGGVETYLDSLQKKFTENGIEYLFVSFVDKESTIKKGKINKVKFLYNAYFTSSTIKQKFSDVIEEYKPDIIHIHNNYLFTKAIIKAAKNKNIPIIQTIHDSYNFNPDLLNKTSLSILENLKKNKFRFIKNNVDHFIATSKIQHQLYNNYNISNSLLNISINTNFWKPKNTEQQEQKNKLLYIGRLEEYKGIYVLLDAFNNMSDKDKYELVYLGEGSEHTKLSNKVASYKESNIKIIGHQTKEEVLTYIQEAYLVIMPSIWQEPFGMVGLEALSCGCPVIASEVGGIPEWCINEFSGLLIPAKDDDLLRKAIERLINNKELYQKIKNNSRNFIVERYSLDSHVDTLQKIYQEQLH